MKKEISKLTEVFGKLSQVFRALENADKQIKESSRNAHKLVKALESVSSTLPKSKKKRFDFNLEHAKYWLERDPLGNIRGISGFLKRAVNELT